MRVIVATITVYYEDGVPEGTFLPVPANAPMSRMWKDPGYTATMKYGKGIEVTHCREEPNISTPIMGCIEYARDSALECELHPR